MQIECVLKRTGGTQVTIGTTEYDFSPQSDGAHVATVEDDDHAQRFLSITEGYKIYRGVEGVSTSVAKLGLPDMLLGSSVHPATFEIGGKTVALGDVVAAAFDGFDGNADAWNALAEEDRHAILDAELDAMEAKASADADERAALATQFEAKFNKKPHYNMGIEKLRAAVEG
jgi:hypothetical protein